MVIPTGYKIRLGNDVANVNECQCKIQSSTIYINIDDPHLAS